MPTLKRPVEGNLQNNEVVWKYILRASLRRVLHGLEILVFEWFTYESSLQKFVKLVSITA